MKMNAQPRAIRRISHHARGCFFTTTVVGELIPVMDGRALVAELDEEGTTTSSERHTPRPGTTDVEALQFAETHVPPWRTWSELEHARQSLGSDPEQLEQLASQDWQLEDVVSKNWFSEQVGRQRPLVRTGRLEGQLAHWSNEEPVQVSQSGWQVRHLPEEENELDGQVETHWPSEAS